MIKRYETFQPKAYKCSAGKWTIGYGSTNWADGTPVKQGDTITEKEAVKLMDAYLEKYVRPNLKPLNLKPNQQVALESLIYNIGWNAFAKSKCYQGIKSKDWGLVFANWDWIRANGTPLKGLMKRRAEEMYLFFKDL